LLYCKQIKIAPSIFYYIVKPKISNANCLDETTILVDTILYLYLYYLVNGLVHLPNLHINGEGKTRPHPTPLSCLLQIID